jgi:Na+/melibiose symporter-like transporter
VLAEKRSGYVIIRLGSLLGLVVAVIHMKGAGVGGTLAKSSGAFFFIWTLLALGVTALFSVILSARGLWERLPRRTDVQHKLRRPCMKRCSRGLTRSNLRLWPDDGQLGN